MSKKIERAELLILDDFGLTPIDQQARTALLDIIEDSCHDIVVYGVLSLEDRDVADLDLLDLSRFLL